MVLVMVVVVLVGLSGGAGGWCQSGNSKEFDTQSTRSLEQQFPPVVYY
jgi:hypothetical protein